MADPTAPTITNGTSLQTDGSNLADRVTALEATVDRLVVFAQATWAGARAVAEPCSADHGGVEVEQRPLLIGT